MNTSYVTTPIYYVNDKPHIGHAYTTILGDVITRYTRLIGQPTFFLTGTDEHGQKVQQAAEKNEISPQQQCDQTVVRFQELWDRLEIKHDKFIRTTDEQHKKVVNQVLMDLYERDLIYKDEYKGSYCVPCERFFTDKDLVDGKCPDCQREVQEIVESNYFFRMSKYQDWLIDYILENPDFIRPQHRRNETLGFLKKPLTDLCISRPKSRLQWGIELPFDSDYVCYVWFDALINYISGIGYGTDEAEFNKWWPASVHLIGKDILTTHTVYWPTMLKAIGLEMPKTIFAHGWWLIGRDKMSKSTGNVVNPMDMCDKYGVDAFRYFLMTEMTPGQDASFTEEAFIKCYNSNLANDLGNMLNRVNKLIFKHFDGKVPVVTLPLGPDEEKLRDLTITAAKHLEDEIKDYHLNRAWDSIMAAVRAGNKYMESKAPWVLAKEGKVEELALVLYSAAESLRLISGLLSPVMPEKMVEMRGALGIDASEEKIDIKALEVWGQLKAGQPLKPIKALFKRIDIKEALGSQLIKPPQSKRAKNVVELIDIEDFSKVALKTAKIISAEPVVESNKLLKVQLEVGNEKRQIVAGIADFYKPEELIGKLVVLVSNLKEAEIRGVRSNGMLLAAKKKKKLALVTIDAEDFPTGASVG
jgi:methionyl-tRNA synthetase